MKIALDAMGGDHAPQEVVKGAVLAAREHGLEVVLVGPRATLEELGRHGPIPASLSLEDARQVITMAEAPTRAIRQKPDSSIMVGMGLLKAGQVGAFVSAGNSGAVMAAAFVVLGVAEGVERPCLGAVFSSPSGPVLLVDVGANPDCKPTFLVGFARQGCLYMQRVFGLERPRVGLLSNGEEASKGNRLVRETHRLLQGSSLNFLGNVESKDILRGQADVVVTDGFTGNIVIKTSEAVTELIVDTMRQALNQGPHLKLAGSIVRPALRSALKMLDYSEYGGAPLLGVRGTVIIAHGRADAKAIKSALLMAEKAAREEMGAG